MPNRKKLQTKRTAEAVRQSRRQSRRRTGVKKPQSRSLKRKNAQSPLQRLRHQPIPRPRQRLTQRPSKRPPQRHVSVKAPKGIRGLHSDDDALRESVDDVTDDDVEDQDDIQDHFQKLPESKLMSKYEERLRMSRFRMLNQKLYVSSGVESLMLFEKKKELFEDYHRGYLQSVQQWSVQPVDVAIKWLRKKEMNWKVVDYGCGEAKIMKAGLPQEVTSLDLVAIHDGVIACDMGESPLNDASMDVAIFSLSLMGTDYHRCLLDAARVLKINGILWIAEVCSRFADRRGKEDYHPFFEAIEKLGFERILSKKPCHLFVVLIFKKVKNIHPKLKIKWPLLKPCLYKRR